MKSKIKVYWLLALLPLIPMLVSLGYERQREEDFIFIFLNAAILYFPLFFLNHHKTYLRILFPFLVLPAMLDFGHILLFQGRIAPSTFFVVFDTNLAESSEFMTEFLSFRLLVLLFMFALGSLVYLFLISKSSAVENKWSWRKYLIIWILLPLCFKAVKSKGNIEKISEAYVRSSQFLTMVVSLKEYKAEIEAFKNYAKGLIKAEDVKRAKKVEGPEIHVLLLGESTTRAHMSIHGYHRNTNPLLEKMRGELYIFNDVMNSAPPGTYANIKKITTFENSETKLGGIQPHIVDVMKVAGFKTYWLSNQQVLGKHDTMTTVIAKQADESYFTNTTNSTTYDEKLLPILDRILKDGIKKKFIVVHLFGTHMLYKYRYPKEYAKFNNFSDIPKMKFHNKKKLKTINHYDNAILYNDFIVSEVIKKIKEQNKYASLVYLSDHGEIIYDDRNEKGHPHNSKAKQVYEIPFILWISDTYKNQNQVDFSGVTDRAYVSDDTIHTLMDLYYVRSKRFVKNKSILAPNFVRKKRWGE